MGHRRQSLLAPSAASALGWSLLSACVQPAGTSGARKHVDESQEIHGRASGPSFTPRQIESIDGVESEDGGLRLGEELLFDEGSAKLRNGASAVLDVVIAMLGREHPGERVVIEGHTDYQPRRKDRFASSMSLGYMRARSVFVYFSEHGIPEDRMQITSYRDSKPIDPMTAHTQDGRRANRRVVIRLAPPGV